MKRKQQLRELGFVHAEDVNGDWIKGNYRITSATIKNAGKTQWQNIISPAKRGLL